MDVLVDRVAGLDVHKEKVTAAVRVPDGEGGRATHVKEFGTFTSTLRELLAWLISYQVSVVAMEATGVYWVPVWQVLDSGDFELQLCNAQHVKKVPGRKTDVSDAVWLAQLTECRFLQPNFVPPEMVNQWRDLTRYRDKMVKTRTSEISRVQKLLEKTGIKLESVIADVMGVSGRDMLTNLIAGNNDPTKLAVLARGRMRTKIPTLELALEGRFGAHEASLLQLQLDHIDQLDATIAKLDAQLEILMLPFETMLTRLQTIPGVGKRIAQVILAEIGPEIGQFPTPGQLTSWAGLCPGNDKSASKSRNAPARKGNAYLRSAMCQAASVAVKSNGSYLSALYRRGITKYGQRGKGKAMFNVAHSMMISIWYMQTRETDWKDLGADYFTKQDTPEAKIARLTRQLEALGQAVTLTPIEDAA